MDQTDLTFAVPPSAGKRPGSPSSFGAAGPPRHRGAGTPRGNFGSRRLKGPRVPAERRVDDTLGQGAATQLKKTQRSGGKYGDDREGTALGVCRAACRGRDGAVAVCACPTGWAPSSLDR
ncbi:unnamed protein product [Lampetra planeri]